MADQQDPVAGIRILDRLQMHLCHERAGGIDGPQPPLGRDATHLRGHTVGGKKQNATLRHLLDRVHEHRPLACEPVDNVLVMDDLVEDVDGGAMQSDGCFERLDGHVHAGAEATRAGKQDLHGDGSGRGYGGRGWGQNSSIRYGSDGDSALPVKNRPPFANTA